MRIAQLHNEALVRPALKPRSWIGRLGISLLSLALRLLSMTWRTQRIGHHPEGPAVRVLWHGHQLPWVLPLAHQGHGVMVSLSDDGSLLADVLQPLGYNLARGSSSRRGREALSELEGMVRNGGQAILAVDGPRGPRHEAHSGAARLALATNTPIIPMGLAVGWGIQLRSWDQFVIPLPFSRVVLLEGAALHPRATAALGGHDARRDVPEVEAGLRLTAEVKAALHGAAELARARLYGASKELKGLRWAALGLCQWLLALMLSPLILLSLAAFPRSRVGLTERLGIKAASPDGKPTVWFHGASLGEARVARAVAEEVRRRSSGAIECLLTVTTPEAREAERGRRPWREVALAPLDLSRPVRQAFNQRRPSAMVVIEGELWPWLLRRAALRGVPAFSASARVSPASARRMRPLGPWLRPVLRSLAAVQPRTPEDHARLVDLGVRSEVMMPSWDLKAIAAPPPAPLKIAQWVGESPLWLAGSTHPGEEQAALMAHREAKAQVPGLKLILAPRRIQRAQELEGLMRQLKVSWVRRSLIDEDPGDADVLLLDTLGELGGCYALGQVAFVGGSLAPHGGHDPMEPAQAGARIIVGPHDDHIQHLTVTLEGAGYLRRAASAADLGPLLLDLMSESLKEPPGPWRPRESRAVLQELADKVITAAQRRLD